MYRIERKEYGFKLTFCGVIDAYEIKGWLIESKQLLVNAPERFGVLVDMRALKPMHDDAQVIMKQGQKLYKQSGMVRSAVVVENVITAMQFRRIAMETDIYEWERYIDTTAYLNWEKVAIDWVCTGIEPDSLQQLLDKYAQSA